MKKNHKKIISDKGFSLIEVLLAVSVLAIGTVGVLRAYATALNTLDVSRNHVDAVCLLKEQIVSIEQSVLEQKGASADHIDDLFDYSDDDVHWEWEINPTEESALSELLLEVSRFDDPRKFSLATYIENQMVE